MNIIITENQIGVLRRIYEIGEFVNYAIDSLNDDIKRGGPGNKPDNFGVYENWVIQRVSRIFKTKYPDIDFERYNFLTIVGGEYNDKIRRGFNKVRKKK
jgi:hypothetical protein